MAAASAPSAPAGRPRRPREPARLEGWQPPLKTSAGIVVCRPGPGGLEALLVLKRYTHAFAEFVHGRYGPPSRGTEAFSRGILALLARMTGEELLLVRSLRFDFLWHRVWLGNGSEETFRRRQADFAAAFLGDGGRALVALVDQTAETNPCLWEIPKGRPSSRREAELFCAVREVQEETGLFKADYRLVPGARLDYSYLSGGVRYVRTYFVALALPPLASSSGRGRPPPRAGGGAAEVGAVRWMGLPQVRLVDGPRRFLEATVRLAFRIVKKFLRGRWACRPGATHLLGPEPGSCLELGLALSPPALPPPPSLPAGGSWGPAGRAGGRARPARSGISSADWRSPPPEAFK